MTHPDSFLWGGRSEDGTDPMEPAWAGGMATGDRARLKPVPRQPSIIDVWSFPMHAQVTPSQDLGPHNWTGRPKDEPSWPFPTGGGGFLF